MSTAWKPKKVSIDLGLAALSVLRRERPDQTFTLEAIAEACECRHEAIRQIQERALAKVRKQLAKELKLAGYSNFAETYNPSFHYISSKRRALLRDDVRYAMAAAAADTSATVIIDVDFLVPVPTKTSSVRWYFLRDAECRPPKEVL